MRAPACCDRARRSRRLVPRRTKVEGSGAQSARGRTFVIAVTDPFQRIGMLGRYFVVHLGVVGRSVMVSIPTIIVIMLAAAVVVAGLLWTEWGHE
jgi:hypothetical protein